MIYGIYSMKSFPSRKYAESFWAWKNLYKIEKETSKKIIYQDPIWIPLAMTLVYI